MCSVLYVPVEFYSSEDYSVCKIQKELYPSPHSLLARLSKFTNVNFSNVIGPVNDLMAYLSYWYLPKVNRLCCLLIELVAFVNTDYTKLS